MELKSSAFQKGEMIPKTYTCDDINISPALEWSSVPEGTKTFTIICDDPDAPSGNFVHWVYYDIPANITGLYEGIKPDQKPEAGGIQGKNDFRKTGYGGPCPPGGTHRYFFKLYAVDKVLGLEPGANKQQVMDAMKGHILFESELMGKYSR
ncbi:MAG: YbhB/YbcL family Raf kinase inhibitor-like protein [Spirochaetes bacterium]|nr:YbhB/YbcL family Raf kinase inhibitor-like protein [Spirochaetota bacterium]